MKFLNLIPLLGLALFASSCRTVTPIDPMTNRQGCKMLPSHFKAHDSRCNHYGYVDGSK
jgi:hypothetical protein